VAVRLLGLWLATGLWAGCVLGRALEESLRRSWRSVLGPRISLGRLPWLRGLSPLILIDRLNPVLAAGKPEGDAGKGGLGC